jgi:hypothetical protein
MSISKSVREARAGLIPESDWTEKEEQAVSRAKQARLLRSAASALELGRLRTAQKKVKEALAPYVLVTVRGGVADLAHTEGCPVEVDILDFDNLEQTGPDDLLLSDKEWEHLKRTDPELFEFFAPSYAKREDA